MSIFKSTFKPFVVRQINARQSLLKQDKRHLEFAQYVSAKSPWVRMTSFVDYQDSSALAKNYILMGGTLYDFNTETGKVKMRAGLGGRGAVYGGDLGNRQYGIRPMPGITNVSVRNIAAYGSLTEATVRFYAWDVKQLEDLSILYMRPGYKVLLEWGWSMYLNTSIKDDNYTTKTDYKTLNTEYRDFTINNTPFNTINCFDTNLNQDIIYEQLSVLRHRYSANYDGVLGYIKNFNYTLQENGSYECNTVLISMGDTIDTIRINDTTGIDIGYSQNNNTNAPSTTNNETSPNQPQVDYSEIKSQFEILFDEYCKLSETNPRANSSIITGIDNLIKPDQAKYIDKFIYKYNSGFSLAPNAQLNPADRARVDFDQRLGRSQLELGGTQPTPTAAPETSRVPEGVAVTENTNQPITVSQDNPGDKRSYYYMQFSYLIHILNVFKTLYPEKSSEGLVTLEIPSNPTDTKSLSNGLCQASFNSISIDPNVAIIRNSKAVLFTDVTGVKGFRPEVFKTETQSASGPSEADYNMREYLYSNTNFGQIGNIYVNIKTVISVYKSLAVSNNGYVYLGEFLSQLLSKMTFALGSINDFDKFVSNNKICIIDKHYTELPADSRFDSKFKINVSGNASIVRKHKIESKIFPSQATMIAIAAQDRQNVASIQTSTYNYLNEGLKDRLFGTIDNQPTPANTDEVTAKKRLLNSILTLVQYVNSYVLVNKTISAFYASNVGAMNGYLNTLLVELEGGTDYKAVVPISVDLEIDGLSGLTIGEIFTVDKKVLPKDYSDKSIGFIVTNVAHEIVTNAWITKIQSQMCILDQEEKQLRSLQKSEAIFGDLNKQIAANKSDNYTSIKYYNILAALVIDSLRGMYRLPVGSEEIVIEKKEQPLYLRSAISEFAPGELDLGSVLIDYTNAYKREFPSREFVLRQPEAIERSIKKTSYYEAMVPDIKNYFDQELTRVLNGYNKYVTNNPGFLKGVFSWDNVSRSYEGLQNVYRAIKEGLKSTFEGAPLPPESVLLSTPGGVGILIASPAILEDARAVLSCTFFKIDINKSVDTNTGLLNQISFVPGYSYYE
jgi:hypothetical protein